jgi:hypothetical protein
MTSVVPFIPAPTNATHVWAPRTSTWSNLPYTFKTTASSVGGGAGHIMSGYGFDSVNSWICASGGYTNETGLPNAATFTTVNGSQVQGQWIQLQVNTGISVGSFQMVSTISTNSSLVKDFLFVGSNDGVNFTELSSFADLSLTSGQVTSFNNTVFGSFKYFRIVVTKITIGKNTTALNSINFFLVRPTVASNNLNLYSTIDGSGMYSTYNAVVDSTGVAITTSKKVNNAALNFQFQNSDSRTVADLVDWLYAEKARTDQEILDRIAGDLANANARTAADTALGNRVTDEAKSRSDADTALGVRIDTLTTDRNASDATLNTSLATEVSTRTSHDTALGIRIDTEAIDRTAADGVLTGRINMAILDRQSGDAACVAAKNSWWNPLYFIIRPEIGTMIIERINGDTALGVRIDQEILDRIEGDADLGERITDEEKSRADADTALGVRVDTETAARIETDTSLVASIATVKAAREAAVLAQKLRIDAILDNSPANLDSLAELVTAYSALNTGKATKVAAFTGDCRSLKTIVSDLREKVYQAFGPDVPDVTPTFPNFT